MDYALAILIKKKKEKRQIIEIRNTELISPHILQVLGIKVGLFIVHKCDDWVSTLFCDVPPSSLVMTTTYYPSDVKKIRKKG